MVSSIVCLVGVTPAGREKSGGAQKAHKPASEKKTALIRDMKTSY